PALRRDDACRAAHLFLRRAGPPPVEGVGRRAGIEPREPLDLRGTVVARVEQDVREGVTDLARRGERARVIAVSEGPTAADELAVDATRDADRETLNAARERPRVARFDDEVHVIALHRELRESEPEPVLPTRKARSEHLHQAL